MEEVGKGDIVALSTREVKVGAVWFRPDRSDTFEGDGERLATIVFVTSNGRTAFYRSSPITYEGILRTGAKKYLVRKENCLIKKGRKFEQYDSPSLWNWCVDIRVLDTGITVSRYSPATPEEYARAEADYQEKVRLREEAWRRIDEKKADYARVAASESFRGAMAAIAHQIPPSGKLPSRVLWEDGSGTRRVYLHHGETLPVYEEYGEFKKIGFEYSWGEKLESVETLVDWHKAGPLPQELEETVTAALEKYEADLALCREADAVEKKFREEMLPEMYAAIPGVKYLQEKYGENVEAILNTLEHC